MKFVKAVGDSFIYFITEAALVPNSIYKESAMVESNSLLLARFIHFTMTIIDSSITEKRICAFIVKRSICPSGEIIAVVSGAQASPDGGGRIGLSPLQPALTGQLDRLVLNAKADALAEAFPERSCTRV